MKVTATYFWRYHIIIFNLCSTFHLIFIVDSEVLLIFLYEKLGQISRNWETHPDFEDFLCGLDGTFNPKSLLKYQIYCGYNFFAFQLFRKNQQRGHGTMCMLIKLHFTKNFTFWWQYNLSCRKIPKYIVYTVIFLNLSWHKESLVPWVPWRLFFTNNWNVKFTCR